MGATAILLKVGGPATAICDTAPFPEGVRAVDDVGLKDGGGDNSRGPIMPTAMGVTVPLLEGVRGADTVGIKDGGSKSGTAAEDVVLKRGGVDITDGASRRACDAVSCAQHSASPGGRRHGASPGGGEGNRQRRHQGRRR